MTRAESLQIYRSWEALWEDNVPLDIPGLSAIIGYWYVRRRRCPPHDDDDAEVSRRGKKSLLGRVVEPSEAKVWPGIFSHMTFRGLFPVCVVMVLSLNWSLY